MLLTIGHAHCSIVLHFPFHNKHIYKLCKVTWILTNMNRRIFSPRAFVARIIGRWYTPHPTIQHNLFYFLSDSPAKWRLLTPMYTTDRIVVCIVLFLDWRGKNQADISIIEFYNIFIFPNNSYSMHAVAFDGNEKIEIVLSRAMCAEEIGCAVRAEHNRSPYANKCSLCYKW